MMRPLVPALSVAVLLAGGCALCERQTAADGRYQVTSDCAGRGLVKGVVVIGGNGSPMTRITTGCVSDADAGVHLTAVLSDAGSVPADAGEPEPSCVETVDIQTSCPDTVASGTAALGIPSQVRVLGDGEFELYGTVAGKYLNCTRQAFGDESLLFCSGADGQIVCSAAISSP